MIVSKAIIVRRMWRNPKDRAIYDTDDSDDDTAELEANTATAAPTADTC